MHSASPDVCGREHRAGVCYLFGRLDCSQRTTSKAEVCQLRPETSTTSNGSDVSRATGCMGDLYN